ncbi:MAG TPA: leucyl/phenylalanyl-tRNA--protein transferase [Candidatus Binatia bacterium]|nr:leucyl/phenylalanyl-tRNA--protein transferase [Candidatus Binatia bacterium]
MVDPETDLVAVGGELRPEVLLAAYRRGIFPWPAEGMPMLWFSPAERAIVEFDRLHLGRTLARARRRSTLRFTVDAAFAAVIGACATVPRPGQQGTWITPEVIAAYVRLHRRGVAHSVEAWHGSRLAGGIYGVAIDGAFSAESMFHREADASKLALVHLVEHLQARGLDWMDVQVLTPHLERLGARTIPRAAFLARLARTRARGLRLFD